MTSELDPDLARKLTDVGLDPADLGDPAAAWLRLHERFGPLATLLDRYALEAARRGIRPEQLSAEERRRLTLDVLTVRTPGRELVPGSERRTTDPIEVVAYDDRWPATFAEWRGMLRGALGGAAVRIEHIGSTAVPGLAAKPVIDIQVGVRDIEDEPAFVPAIEALGVALRLREPGHRFFRPSGDRPRTMQIHVYQAGSTPERDHLLFRDFLRADMDTCEAYARMKREVARRFRDDRIAYNEAKTGFILDAMDRARAWALRTGWDISRPGIRPAEPRDARAMARVHVRSWQVAYRGQLPDGLLDGLTGEIDQRTAFWERSIAEAASRRWTLLVADEDDRVTGFATFGPSRDEPDVGEVYAIYVDPTYWDRGHGRALFAAAVRGLIEAGYREATLWVLGSNARARRFYEIAGWVADGAVKTEHRGEVELREVRYGRDLTK